MVVRSDCGGWDTGYILSFPLNATAHECFCKAARGPSDEQSVYYCALVYAKSACGSSSIMLILERNEFQPALEKNLHLVGRCILEINLGVPHRSCHLLWDICRKYNSNLSVANGTEDGFGQPSGDDSLPSLSQHPVAHPSWANAVQKERNGWCADVCRGWFSFRGAEVDRCRGLAIVWPLDLPKPRWLLAMRSQQRLMLPRTEIPFGAKKWYFTKQEMDAHTAILPPRSRSIASSMVLIKLPCRFLDLIARWNRWTKVGMDDGAAIQRVLVPGVYLTQMHCFVYGLKKQLLEMLQASIDVRGAVLPALGSDVKFGAFISCGSPHGPFPQNSALIRGALRLHLPVLALFLKAYPVASLRDSPSSISRVKPTEASSVNAAKAGCSAIQKSTRRISPLARCYPHELRPRCCLDERGCLSSKAILDDEKPQFLKAENSVLIWEASAAIPEPKMSGLNEI
ncbi:hypothetical protein Nepgr_015898 [Nepenthes gracilis]|uniref:Uncharacterized protein n=1 Tax=Nepenthes gracilis TaxID=150966 RepID=A0AAD3SP28_NEPGR|nr:hypothetical protein Nepgr_015898 [Nepenthes gracilis]